MVDTSPAAPPLTPGEALTKLFLDNADRGYNGKRCLRGSAAEAAAGQPGASQPQRRMTIPRSEKRGRR